MKTNWNFIFRCTVMLALVVALGAGLAYSMIQVGSGAIKPGGSNRAPEVSRLPTKPAALASLSIHKKPLKRPVQLFFDGDRKEVHLNDLSFRSKVLVVNLWATWCVPCVRELPDLDALQAQLGGKDFEVVAINQDIKGIRVAKPFMKEHNLKNLKLYVDPKSFMSRSLKAQGLPTTYIIDFEGFIRADLLGVAEWNSPEVVTYLKELIEIGKSKPGAFINK